MQGKPMLIGAVAKRTGINLETVRYYERIGLVPHPRRSGGRHRVYDESHVRRLSFIRRSRELGFPIDGVRALLALADGDHETCNATREITLGHLTQVRAKIAALRKLERALKRMSDACRPGDQEACPILDSLGAAA